MFVQRCGRVRQVDCAEADAPDTYQGLLTIRAKTMESHHFHEPAECLSGRVRRNGGAGG